MHATSSEQQGFRIIGLKKTHVPTSVEDFKQFYLSGKNALIPNLPHRLPHKTCDGTYSYVF